MNENNLSSLMNNTKWKEKRNAMIGYPRTTKWRTKDIRTGYLSEWDSEWFYHFSEGGYKTIEYLEIRFENQEMKSEILKLLMKVHVPGELKSESIIIYGYKEKGHIDYL